MSGINSIWHSRLRRKPPRRLPGIEPLEDRRLLSNTYVVTTTFDDSLANGGITGDLLSLRQAIELVNLDTTDTPGDPDRIVFNIFRDLESDGIWTIAPTTPLPALTNPVIIDGTTQPGYVSSPVIKITGANIRGAADGLTLAAGSGSSNIKSLQISDFLRGSGILVAGSSGSRFLVNNLLSNNGNGIGTSEQGGLGEIFQGNMIQGNTIGINLSGTAGTVILGNQIHNNTIGMSLTASGANTIVGNEVVSNTSTGVILNGSGSNNVEFNLVQSNATGVALDASYGNTIQNNQFQFNTTVGLSLINSGGTTILGNKILANTLGLNIQGSGSNGNTIGGTTDSARNVISGNTTDGISLTGGIQNLIEGNWIGLASDGSLNANGRYGISLNTGANSNSIGGTTSGARNVISGGASAIQVIGARSNTIIGNYIGTNADGSAAAGADVGVFLGGSNNSVVNNLISGNSTVQIHVLGQASGSNLISGNLIGTNASGQKKIAVTGNTVGILIENSPGNTIGPNNVIAGFTAGINLAGEGASGNVIRGNEIGTNAAPAGTPGLDNTIGVYVNGAPDNLIGGTNSDANIVSGNTESGIYIYGTSSHGNRIQGNIIGLAADGLTPFPASGSGTGFTQKVGIAVYDSSRNQIGGSTKDEGNVLTGNATAGVYIVGHSGSSSGNQVENNRIGLSAEGSRGAGNGMYGVLLYNAPGNQVNRTGADANQFAGNGIMNVRIYNTPGGSALAMRATRARARHARTRHQKG